LMDAKALGGLIGRYITGGKITDKESEEKKAREIADILARAKERDKNKPEEIAKILARAKEEGRYFPAGMHRSDIAGQKHLKALRLKDERDIAAQTSDTIPTIKPETGARFFSNVRTRTELSPAEREEERSRQSKIVKRFDTVKESEAYFADPQEQLRDYIARTKSEVDAFLAKGVKNYRKDILGLEDANIQTSISSKDESKRKRLTPKSQEQFEIENVLNKILQISNSQDPQEDLADYLRDIQPKEIGSHAKDMRSQMQSDYLKSLHGATLDTGGLLPSYQTGTSYVPYNQMAYLHKGEAVVPAEYNAGGLLGVKGYAPGGDIKSAIKELVNVRLKLESDTIKISNLGEITTAVTRGLESSNIRVTAALDTSSISAAVAEGMTVATGGTGEVRVVNLGEITSAINTLSAAGGVGADTTDGAVEEIIRKFDNRLDTVVGTMTEHRTILDKVVGTITNIDIQELRDINKTVTASVIKMEKVEGNINNLVSTQDLNIAINEMNSGLETRLTELVTSIETRYISPITVDINGINTKINILDYDIKDVNDVLNSTISRQDLNMSGVV